MTSSAPRRPARPSTTLTVRTSERITPNMHRVSFDAPGFTPSDYTDMYVKLLFPSATDPTDTPVRRTYTVRSFDPTTEILIIDFVIHGDEGIAAPWAASTQAGDQIQAMGPGGGFAPLSDVDWHLFVADMSSLPASAAALESLSSDARGFAVIHITDEQDRTELSHPSGVEVHWLVGPSSETALLHDALSSAPWHLGTVSVFAHGERESIKLIRRVLRDREIPRERISISGYWALGRTEDLFQAEKREPIGTI